MAVDNRNTGDVAVDIRNIVEEAINLTEDDTKISSDSSNSIVRIVDISHDSTRDTEDGDTAGFDMCLESVTSDGSCVLCGSNKCDLVLTCLHTICATCAQLHTQTVTCPVCKVTTEASSMVHLTTAVTTGNGDQSSGVNGSLLTMARSKLEQEIPTEVTKLDTMLTDLQEENDNSKSRIQETYQSYRAILEQCMNYALEDLDSRHHRKELAIMERLEQMELARRQLELAVSWAGKCDLGQQQQAGQLGDLVTRRMEAVLTSLQSSDQSSHQDLGINLEWSSDKEQFTRSVKDHFGQFSDSGPGGRDQCQGGAPSIVMMDTARSPRLLVSDHGAEDMYRERNKDLMSGFVSPDPGLSHHNLTPGLLSLGPMSPLSPVSPVSLTSPGHSNRSGSAGHGPIGSALTSPAHHYRSHLGLSHPDLSGASSPLKQSHNSNNLEYNLSELTSSMDMERPRSGFTLAELISNVTDDHDPSTTAVSVTAWDNDPSPRGPHQTNDRALSNLAALAKLEQGGPWSGGQDTNLLLPDSILNHDAVSPVGQHSLSPVLGLGPRGTSPLSPIDSLMPGLGGLSLSPTNLMRSPSSPGGLAGLNSGGGRSLNSMQIRCKFGQLGPGKGQFNSPHGFCLGVEEEIIVADTNNHRIQVFEKNGTYRYQFGVAGKEEGQLWYPRKVAVMKSTGKYVVCDRGNERSRMQIFTRHGHFVRKIAIRYIDIVAGLAITREGHIVAVDSVTPTIFVIQEHGELLRWFDCADYMREPSDIAVSGREFYVCDFKGHNVVVFTEEGQYVRRIGCENITNFPNGIDISDAGDILIGDSHGNKFHVVVFSNDGGLLGEFECPHVKVSRCCGLKITSEGYVVTLAKNNHHVLVLNTLYIQ